MEENPFDLFTEEYEEWFKENEIVFQTELLALSQLVPSGKNGLEIGIGSGIFAEKLGIATGIDPSENMLRVARSRGLKVKKGFAEQLPYNDEEFEYAVFITSLCFISNPRKALQEAFRILKPRGTVVVAIIDRESLLGKSIEETKSSSKFYRHARLYSVPKMLNLLMQAGFEINRIIQTLREASVNTPEKPAKGFGQGRFVVIEAIKRPV